MRSGSSARMRYAIAGVAAAALVLSGCSDDGSGPVTGDDSGGVPYGAPVSEWVEALADMDPITLVYQANNANESVTGAQSVLDAVEYIEERSGGKISIEIAWANSVVPNIGDIDLGLADGRIDMAKTLPVYEPDIYPANDALISSTLAYADVDGDFIHGAMVNTAAWMQAAFEDDTIMSELEDQGLIVATSMWPTWAPMMSCSNPVDSAADWGNRSVRINSTGVNAIFTAIGSTTVSIPFTEAYEGLQRDVYDCTIGAFDTIQLSHFQEVAPYIYYADTAALPIGPAVNTMGTRVTELPTAAQQLIFDAMFRQGVYEMKDYLDHAQNTIEEITAAGGGVFPFDDETQQTMLEANGAILDDVRASSAIDGAAFLDRAGELQEHWDPLVSGLEFPDGDLSDFLDWYERDDFDLEPYIDLMYEEFLNDHRPGV